MASVRYRGFDIVPRSYEIADTGFWTVDFEIRRGDRVRAFSVPEHHPTREEAEAQCVGFGRRIIEGRVKGWSVDALRRGYSIWAPIARLLDAGLGLALVALAAIYVLGRVILRAV